VYVPQGIYKISSSLVVTATLAAPHSNVTIQGDGPGATILRATNALANAAVLKFDGSQTHHISLETIRDIGIDISAAASGRGIEFIIGQYVTVDHVRIVGPSGANTAEGIRLDGGPDPNADFSAFNRISGSYIQRMNVGINLMMQVTATSITDNHITGGFQPGQHGIEMTRYCAGIAVHGNEIEGWDIGIHNSGSGLMAVGNRFEGNTTAHIKFEQEPPGGTTMWSMAIGNANWGAAPMVVTPHTPNAYLDAITMFDVNDDFSIPNKVVQAYGYNADGQDGRSLTKTIQTPTGTCTMRFVGGILVGGTC
jgi:hypothetical protein